MKRKYAVLLSLDVWIAAGYELDAEKRVRKELENDGGDILELDTDPVSIPLCAATLQAVRQIVVRYKEVIEKEIIEARMTKELEQMGSKTRRADAIAAIEKRKDILDLILSETHVMYNTQAIYTVSVSMNRNVLADSEDEALEEAAKAIEKPGRVLYDRNIKEDEGLGFLPTD